MSVIQLDGKVYPISEKVGAYIDSLVDANHNQRENLKGIAVMAKSWLESDCNTVDKAKEKVAFSLIFDLAHKDEV